MRRGPSLTVKDRTKEFNARMAEFKKDKVVVGIPATNDARREGGPINNATLLFINEFGSPGQNIPPRPVMAIGIRRAKDKIAEEFEKAAKAGLKDGPSNTLKYYERAGMIAASSIKQVINDQIEIEGPAKSTLKSREAKGFLGTKSLIVTGQLRNAITYVVNAGGE